MSRRTSRSWKPAVEAVEARRLLSAVTAVMAGNQQMMINRLNSHSILGDRSAAAVAAVQAKAQSGFDPSRYSIAQPENQGPQGTNLLLQPVGQMTPRQFNKSMYTATFVGPYTIGPGRFDSEALQLSVRGVGRTTNIRHADIQMGLIVAKDPGIQNSGVSTIYDRSINSNSALGFDLASPRTDVDSHGRPNRFVSVALDTNISAGTFVEGFSQGVMEIRYAPSRRRARGVLEQGTAYVKFVGQVYAPNVANILRNASINP